MKKILITIVCTLIFSGCVSVNDKALDSSASQVTTRNYQTKSFDTTDSTNVLKNIISTMQDLNFIIEKADNHLGTVTGYSFSNKTNMTVTVSTRGKQTFVRANAEYNKKAITDPLSYQNFFNALSQSLFLTANDVM